MNTSKSINLTNPRCQSILLNYKWFLLLLPLLINAVEPAFAQTTITVNQTTPCFLNQTAGIQMWENCGFKDDWLTASLLPFEWITGGYFSLLIVSIILLMIYLKYHQMIYVIVIMIIFLPISFQFFPGVFLTGMMITVVLAIAGYIYYMLKRQTE